jgi:hypothetical protein
MNKSFTENILNPSLEIIRNDTKIKYFYFFPSTMSVLFLSVLLVYQVVYTYVVLLGNKDALVQIVLDVFHSPYANTIIIVSVIFILFYVILTPIFEWGLIRYIQKRSEGEASRSDAIWFWIVRFYALFEYNNIFNMFKLISIINGYLFTLRFLWLGYLTSVSIVFIIAFLFSILLNILIAYARYEIVLENKSVFSAIWTSSQIALLNIKTTMRLYVLMFVMNIKVVINFFIFLIFPIMSALIIGYISSQTYASIALVMLWWLFVFLLIVLGYLAAVLEVFTTAIWYHAYKEGKEKYNEITH